MDASRLRALLDAGRALVSELDPDTILRRLLDVARELTGARYAAIGVLDDNRVDLERFLTAGIDEEGHRAIGDLPRGRGVLGVLVSDPKPLRLHDVGEHPLSYGFPPAHPPMHTFLGVPILIQGSAWGNLYLTDKPEDFTSEDEEAAVVLSEWAAVAIVNARLYRAETSRRADLERANRALETTTEVAKALGGITDVNRALELIVKRSRALIGARAAELAILEGDEIVIAAIAGEGATGLRGTRLPLEGSLAATVLQTGRSQRFEELPEGVFARQRLGASRAMLTPMVFKSRMVGVLMVFDRTGDDLPFTPEDQRLIEAFAASAAMAVATAQSATDQALRRSVAASEAERQRWSRELHDETLQEMAALRVVLSAARRSDDPQRWRSTIDDAVEQLGAGIHNLRALITDLRPAALDELGIEAALEALVKRTRQQHGLDVSLSTELAATRLSPEVEETAYRFVQEGLTNVVKHAHARTVSVNLVQDRRLRIEVRDDGQGYGPDTVEHGFGILGMRERLALLGGTLEVESVPGAGTTVRACL